MRILIIAILAIVCAGYSQAPKGFSVMKISSNPSVLAIIDSVNNNICYIATSKPSNFTFSTYGRASYPIALEGNTSISCMTLKQPPNKR